MDKGAVEMKGVLSPRELAVFTATPVKKKPAPKRKRISVVEFLAEMKAKREKRLLAKSEVLKKDG